ncbi:MAG TPA: hypothetical protein VJA40_05775 [archaeon]|nr:hypothetical protein [archaeon]
MNLKLVALVVFGAALVLSYFLFTSAVVQEFKEDVDEETKTVNSQVYATLAAAGISEPFVDFDRERVYVAYELPEGFDSIATQRFVIGAAADATVGFAEKILAIQYEDDEPRLLWSVKVADVQAFVQEELSLEEFEARIEKQAL